MALNAFADSFCHNQKKCGSERVKLTQPTQLAFGGSLI